ncbi:hypothetical protein WJ21_26805 [Burkholderia vietnamiensis]|uniref:hypothetical protein n=1 Tax=Burkholderia vietnamiensis TaxID=60552 RepID=UPI000759601F|nr:hypothetical protein [Burkholderia vietnamiensis]KVF93505.1 hypothetical protein WJ21_26805 [Burkholderia vietnamiensis]
MTPVLSQRFRAAARGWSSAGRYVNGVPGSPEPIRQGCRWTDKEDFDLLDAFTTGTPFRLLVAIHQRAPNAIEMRLGDRCMVGALRYMLVHNL